MKTLPDLNGLPLAELFAALASGGLVRRLIELARDEDLGAVGDITSRAWFDDGGAAPASARLVARESGTVAGLAALPLLRDAFAPASEVRASVSDGAAVEHGAVLATLRGPGRELLAIERTMLNLIGRLSGIATLTSRYRAAKGADVRARLFDTRKTTPGLRLLEKYAVRCGGGFCHRLGLHDAVLVKDNHVAHVPLAELAQRATSAARRARADRPLRFVQIEVDTLEQFRELLRAEPGAIDLVLLDNMPPELLRRAVAMRDEAQSTIELEASGGVNLETIRAIAESGVDRISVGALTHQATGMDVALDFE